MDMDFTPPFRRVSMISGLEEVLGVKIPGGSDMRGREGGSCDLVVSRLLVRGV